MDNKLKIYRMTESQYKKIEEFVSVDGGLIKSKKPNGHEGEITNDITTDEFIDKTRTRDQKSPHGSYHSLSFGALQENDVMSQLPQSVVHNLNELVNSVKEHSFNPEQTQMLIQLLTNSLNG